MNVVSFISEYTITIGVVILIVGSVFVNWLFIRNESNGKIATEKNHRISKKEYGEFFKNNKEAIVNTTVSFRADHCKCDNEIFDLYARTIVVGNKLLREDGFKISAIRKV